MREKNIVAIYVFLLFLFFFALAAFAIFVVLVDSGSISLSNQPLSVSSFSCTPSGTAVNLYKSVGNYVNVTSLVLNVDGSVVPFSGNYVIDSRYFTVYLPYRCLSGYSVISVNVYYSDYTSAENKQPSTGNFFSKLISQTAG